MPANLTPQYHDAEEKFKQAATPGAKIEALEEMLRVIPKHKGTEKLQAELKKRLSKLRKEPQGKSQTASHRPSHSIEKEGAGQVAVCGPANSGKSSLVDCLTEARPEVADYPFTTRSPQAGMARFEDVQIQLVDMPPLAPEVLEPWHLALLGQADVLALLFDVNDPSLLDQTEFVLERLEERGIRLIDSADSRPRVIVLGNKIDAPQGRDNFQAWMELYGGRLSARAFSCKSAADLEHAKRIFFESLDKVRVYTKKPGQSTESVSSPFLLPRGATVLDAAAAVHKDLATHFKFAKLWGKTRFDGQMVERTHIVEDGDIVEIHAG